MKKKRVLSTHHLTLVVILLLMSLALPACFEDSSGSQPDKPVASITTPQDNSSFAVGDPVVIQFTAADVKGVRQVELTIDGRPVRVETVEPPVNSYVANHVWTPETPGTHAIELRTFNVDGAASDPVRVLATITEAAAGATTPTLVPVPTLPPLPDTPTPLPPTDTPAAAAQPTPTPSPAAATVTALVGLNVRGGPGTNYPVVGKLLQNQSAQIVGRNSPGTWWQIIIPGASDRGWVSGGAQFSTASNTEGVPVVEAPPPPTPAPTATDTPAPLKPTIHSFTADRYTIAPNEEVVLRWDLSGAQAAYLRYEDREEGVVAPGQKTVSPEEDTVYTLVARNEAGETTAQVTIKIGGATPTPVAIYRDGKTRIVHDQTIDFDQGVIQQGSNNPGADFYWDGQAKQFERQPGSSGTMLGREFDDISFEVCRSADYGRPIPEIDPNTRITGCYLTNEGRYGKFWVSEWDISGNLTIIWSTWQRP